MDIVPTVDIVLEKKWKEKGMKPELARVRSTATISEAREEMAARNTGSVCVFDAVTKKFAGLVTERDIARKVGKNDIDWDSPVTTIMTPAHKVKSVTRSMTVYDCMAIFGRDMGHAPVLGEKGEPEDMVTKGDCLFALHGDTMRRSYQMEGRLPSE